MKINLTKKEARKRLKELKEEQEIEFNPYREANIEQLEEYLNEN